MRAVFWIRRGAAVFLVAWWLPASAMAQVMAPVTRLSMADAERLALLHNQAMQAQRLSVDASKADEVTAGIKPNMGISFAADGLSTFSPRQLTPDFLRNDVSYGVAASYLWERGGKRNNRITVAKSTTEVTAIGVTDAERQLRFQTAQAFIGLLLAKSTLELAQQNLKSFSDVVDVDRQRVTSGDLAEGEFFKISLQKLQFEQDASAAEVAVVQARAALRQLVGYETVTEDFEPVGDLTHSTQALDLESLKTQALETRADLLAARSGVTLAQNTLALENSNNSRDVTGGIDYTHVGPSNTLGVSAGFDLAIHDHNQGNIAKSEVQVRQATQSELATRYLVLTDVVNAYAGWQTAQKVVALYESGYLDQAKQSLDISRYVYQRGAGSLLDLLDAERTYRDTQLGYRQALSNYMASAAQLNLAVGKQVIVP